MPEKKLANTMYLHCLFKIRKKEFDVILKLVDICCYLKSPTKGCTSTCIFPSSSLKPFMDYHSRTWYAWFPISYDNTLNIYLKANIFAESIFILCAFNLRKMHAKVMKLDEDVVDAENYKNLTRC
jgi:hypothetical protein